MNRLWKSKRGTSLVEILVVMVILAVGIMTVVQMFPSGFRVVRAAENETIATKLAERELERWKGMAANLPTGILPVDDNGALINDQDPGPPFIDWKKNVAGHYESGNVFNIRRIYGETTRIPVGTYFQTGSGVQYGARYTLAFSPIDVTLTSDGVYDGLSIKSGDMRRRTGDASSYPPYLRAGEYAVDYGDDTNAQFNVAFAQQSVEAVYYISYSFWVADSGNIDTKLISVVNQRIPETGAIPDNTSDWQTVTIPVGAIPSGYHFTEVEQDTDTCARGFMEVGGAGYTAGNPYEYALADSLLGVIAFNPVGRNILEPTAQGMRPIEARIDYRIRDLRILREDKVIAAPANASATTIPVKLALRFILNIGDPVEHPDPDQQTYKGLAPGVEQPLLIIDLATGLRVAKTDTMAGGTHPGIADIDFKAGVVNLPVTVSLVSYDNTCPNSGTESVSIVGRHLRFFYRADGDWTVQCQKAFALYARDWMADSPGSSPDYCHYRLVGNSKAKVKRLKFARTEFGKSVAVDYSYTLNSAPNSPSAVDHKIVGEAHTLADITSDGDGCYADLNVPDGATIKRIYSVVGTSFKVRVLWRDGVRWRYVDMDTNLMRSSD